MPNPLPATALLGTCSMAALACDWSPYTRGDAAGAGLVARSGAMALQDSERRRFLDSAEQLIGELETNLRLLRKRTTDIPLARRGQFMPDLLDMESGLQSARRHWRALDSNRHSNWGFAARSIVARLDLLRDQELESWAAIRPSAFQKV